MTEEWRAIPDWEGYYEVSSHGQIRSVERVARDGKTYRGQPRSLNVCKNGYMYVSLYRDREAKYSTVHRLVMLAFVGPRPERHDVCHRNGVRTDNRVENLYYGTRRENNLDKREHGTDPNARKTHCKHGHEFDAVNTYWTARGGRACRTCSGGRASRVAKARRKPDLLERRRR